MKLYMNGMATTDSESLARSWKDHEHKVYVIDAEEYVPPAPKPERWRVVDTDGKAIGGRRFFTIVSQDSGVALSFDNERDAICLIAALKCGGMTGLRVVKIEESE